MKHLALFNGIGGFQLAASWAGWNNVASCEIDGFCNKVTKYWFPQSIQHEDIRTTDFTIYAGKIDIITGGFPCQGFSVAGLRLGTFDPRFLWPEMLTTVKTVRPNWVVAENVTGILTMEDLQQEVFAKVESRNIIRLAEIDRYEGVYTRQSKMLINRICEDLEKEGYTTQTVVIPAGAVGAPHRRDRTWIIANSFGAGTGSIGGTISDKGRGAGKNWRKGIRQAHGTACAGGIDAANSNGLTTHANSYGQQRRDWENEEYTSEGRQHAQCNIEQGTCNGDVTHTGCQFSHGRESNQPGQSEYNGQDIGREGAANKPERLYTPADAANSNNEGCASARLNERSEGAEQGGQSCNFYRENEFENASNTNQPPAEHTIPTGRDEFAGEDKRDVADACSTGRQEQHTPGFAAKPGHLTGYVPESPGDWANFPAQSPVCNGDDGLSESLDGITFSNWRNNSIKAGGNAIVPQVAFEIFKGINITNEAFY